MHEQQRLSDIFREKFPIWTPNIKSLYLAFYVEYQHKEMAFTQEQV